MWPSVTKLAEAVQDEPVVLFVVNSGNPQHEVKSYMNRVGVDLPTIVDKNRELEREFDFGKITLKNTLQCRVVRPDGSIQALPTRPKPDILKNVKGSPSWLVEPAKVPEKLKPLWRAVEFGKYRQAAQMFQQVENSDKHKQIVKRLKSGVHKVCEKQLNRADELKQSGKPWEAYKLLRQVTLTFQAYPNFNPPKSFIRSLEENETVQREQSAKRVLRKIKKKQSQLGAKWSRPALQKALAGLIKKFPDTEAAEEAKELKAR